jgi:3-methyl-2-oxobutanoate hydroxymethyltransferase
VPGELTGISSGKEGMEWDSIVRKHLLNSGVTLCMSHYSRRFQTSSVSHRITVPSLQARKLSLTGSTYHMAEPRIVALTAYDFSSARVIDEAGVDIVLVGDSLANLIQGLETTLPVTLDEMIYHARCVVRAVEQALVIGDLPFLSYQISPEQALQSAGRFIKEAGVGAVKLEGGQAVLAQVEKIVSAGIPVMGHLGLTPQSVLAMGGYRVQGRTHRAAGMLSTEQEICEAAEQLVRAGIFSLVLEGVPEALGKKLSETLPVPVIGIGAGRFCDGQILVTHDMLGLGSAEIPRFVRSYAQLGEQMRSAVQTYAEDVRERRFPAKAEVYSPIDTPELSDGVNHEH